VPGDHLPDDERHEHARHGMSIGNEMYAVQVGVPGATRVRWPFAGRDDAQ